MPPVFEIDTKGICLLCLSSKNDNISEGQKASGKLGDGDSDSAIAFRMLLRYLKVDVTQLPIFSSLVERFGFGLKNVNLSVGLCEECSSVANDFLDTFHMFERIRLQLDVYVSQLYGFMKRGSLDEECVQEFQKRMTTGDMKDLIGRSVAESLRKETFEKACLKLGSSIPRITLNTLDTKQEENEKMQDKENTSKLVKNSQLKSVDITENEGDKEIEIVEKKPAVDKNLCSVIQTQIPLNPSVTKDKQVQKNSEVNTRKNESEKPPPSPEDDIKPEASLLECVYCQRNFTHKIYLRAHQYNKHAKAFLSDQGVLPPRVSEQELESALAKILAQMTANAMQCPLCDKGFEGKTFVRPHLLQKHLSQIVDCEAPSPPQIINAVTVEKNKSIENSEKNSSTDKTKSTATTVNEEPEVFELLNSSQWRCTYCGIHFSQKLSLQQHHYRSHAMSFLTDKGLLPSTISEQGLSNSLKNIRDQMITPNSNSLQCPFCRNKNFHRETQWRTHLLQHHLQTVIDNAEKTSFEGELLDSIISKPVTKITLKKCAPCGKYFPNKASFEKHQLQTHMMTVLKDRLLPPSISEGSILASVERIISRAKKVFDKETNSKLLFECPWCQKRERRTLKFHLLKRHLEKVVGEVGDNHTPESPEERRQQMNSSPPAQSTTQYKCSSCGKQFSSQHGLKLHFVRKHLAPQKKRWKCDHCRKFFAKQLSLSNHLISYHPVAYFADLIPIPAGVTNQDFHDTITGIVCQCKITAKDWRKKISAQNSLLNCTYCGKKVNEIAQMRLHIARSHFDKVIEDAGKNCSGRGDVVEGGLPVKWEEQQRNRESVDSDSEFAPSLSTFLN